MISFTKESQVFHLRTKNSCYQMQVAEHGYLLHLYYGEALNGDEVTGQLLMMDRGFSPNPCDAGRDRTFSLDILPQEYSAAGNGDYHSPALEVENADGSLISDLRYVSHEILPGKYSLEGLPAMFAREGERVQTLKITLKDPVNGLRAELWYGVFEELDVITRAAVLINEGELPLTLEKAASMQIDFQHQDFDLIRFHGRHLMERIPERAALTHGITALSSTRGCSSHQMNPFAILCRPDTTEKSGDCYGFTFVYSGNFLFEAELDQFAQTRLLLGIHPEHFSWSLQPGGCFICPEVILSYSHAGFSLLSNRLHDAMRENLIRSKYAKSPRPVLVNNWEATYFDFHEEDLLRLAKTAKEVGLDLFVLDDGWFSKRNSDFTSLGDWTVDEDKIRGGLFALSEKIRALGLSFGLWIEPEMVSEESALYRAHPDWCFKIPGRAPTRGRYQLNLDFSRREVREAVMEKLFELIERCRIRYIKWDFNRNLGNIYSLALPPERQGEVFHRYMLGLYEMMEQLVSRFPDLLFENCAGGGGRFDAGMLYYSPQIWCSDDTDAVSRLFIQHGSSFGYPVSAMGAHVSVCPNHQTGRTVPASARALVASVGTFGYEMDLSRLSDQEKELVKEQIRLYKEKEPVKQTGDYYRLTDPADRQGIAAWELASKDRRTVYAEGVILHPDPNGRGHLLRLAGLDPSALYRCREDGRRYSGAALMRAGLLIRPSLGDYQSFSLRFDRCALPAVRPEKLIFDVGGILIGFRWQEMLTKDRGLSLERALELGRRVFDSPLWQEFDLQNFPFDAVVDRYCELNPGFEEDIRWLFAHADLMAVKRPKVWEKIGELKKAGYEIYLLSNYSDRMFEMHTGGASFHDLLDGGLISFEVHHIKPGDEIYRALFDRFGLDPSVCLFFDDREENTLAAKRNGMASVCIGSEEQLLACLDELLMLRGGR